MPATINFRCTLLGHKMLAIVQKYFYLPQHDHLMWGIVHSNVRYISYKQVYKKLSGIEMSYTWPVAGIQVFLFRFRVTTFLYLTTDLVRGLITFTSFHVPCHMTHQGGGAARCRVKAAVLHISHCHKWHHHKGVRHFLKQKKKEGIP